MGEKVKEQIYISGFIFGILILYSFFGSSVKCGINPKIIINIPPLIINSKMAVPKRKTSKSRRNKRRSHHRISSANIIEDKKSGEFRLSHHVDLKTGLYKGRQVFEPKK